MRKKLLSSTNVRFVNIKNGFGENKDGVMQKQRILNGTACIIFRHTDTANM